MFNKMFMKVFNKMFMKVFSKRMTMILKLPSHLRPSLLMFASAATSYSVLKPIPFTAWVRALNMIMNYN